MRTKFAKTVENNNLFGVRQALADEMLIAPRGNGFKEMLAYAEQHLPDLYETDNGAVYTQNESEWTKDLLHNLKYDLSKNFSREKLTLFVKMAQYVLKDKVEKETEKTDKVFEQKLNDLDATKDAQKFKSEEIRRKAQNQLKKIKGRINNLVKNFKHYEN